MNKGMLGNKYLHLMAQNSNANAFIHITINSTSEKLVYAIYPLTFTEYVTKSDTFIFTGP